MTENNQKGLLTELQCELYFSSKNLLLSKPICQDSRYDYVLDYNGILYKIQCKSSLYKEDKLVFKTKMSNARQNTTTYYKSDDVDFFYTFYNGVSYLIPYSKSGKGETTLRFVSKTPNNPTIRWAKDYEADKILSEIALKEEVV